MNIPMLGELHSLTNLSSVDSWESETFRVQFRRFPLGKLIFSVYLHDSVERWAVVIYKQCLGQFLMNNYKLN